MNFSNYTRVQLGLPPASADAGMAAVRRARVMQMNGFGAMAISQVTGKPCSAGDYESYTGDKWPGYCNCLFIPGSAPMKVCCGKENVLPDGSCGPGAASSLTGGATTGFWFAPWTVPGKLERTARGSDLGAAANNLFTAVVGGQTGGGGGGGGPGDTETPPVVVEQPKDNTMLILGGAAIIGLGLVFAMRK